MGAESAKRLLVDIYRQSGGRTRKRIDRKMTQKALDMSDEEMHQAVTELVTDKFIRYDDGDPGPTLSMTPQGIAEAERHLVKPAH